jgi:hypothetical protein
VLRHRRFDPVFERGFRRARALNATLPLASTVLTSVKPAASKQRLSSDIFAFIGLTPRRKAR